MLQHRLNMGRNLKQNHYKQFHDDTTSDEKYEFTYSVVFSATEPSWKGLISVTEKAFDTVWRDGLW
jgi:hypothetical protein